MESCTCTCVCRAARPQAPRLGCRPPNPPHVRVGGGGSPPNRGSEGREPRKKKAVCLGADCMYVRKIPSP